MNVDAVAEFSRFAEDARLGWLGLGPRNRHQTKFDRDLSIPVLNFDRGGIELDMETLWMATKAIRDGSLHLPFPECVFVYTYPKDHFASLQSHSTVWMVVMYQTETEIVGNLFYRHPEVMEHFGVNRYQFVVTADDVEMPDDPRVASHADPEVEDYVRRGARDRALAAIYHAYLLATQPQAVTAEIAPDTPKLTAVNRRRERAGLQPLDRIRTIVIDQTRVKHAASDSEARMMAVKQPHWRRGHWRTYESGKTVWVRASAINGGGTGEPPAWYNVRTAVAA